MVGHHLRNIDEDVRATLGVYGLGTSFTRGNTLSPLRKRRRFALKTSGFSQAIACPAAGHNCPLRVLQVIRPHPHQTRRGDEIRVGGHDERAHGNRGQLRESVR